MTDYLANDAADIAKRMKEIEAENSLPPPPPTVPECVGCDVKRKWRLNICDTCPHAEPS